MRIHIIIILFIGFVVVQMFNSANLKAQGLESTEKQSIQTPEVASLGNYGDLPVNLYTGTYNFSLPLAVLETTVTSIPVSINYNASGIRVDDKAGEVGLGWSLTAGGVITRTAQSIPDDQYEEKLYQNYENVFGLQRYQESINPAWDAFDEIASGNHTCSPTNSNTWDLKCLIFYPPGAGFMPNKKYASKPDIFSYSFNGRSGKFIIPDLISSSSSGEALLLPYDNLTITWHTSAEGRLNEFIIRDDSGISYYFDKMEVMEEVSVTKNNTSSDWLESEVKSNRYASSWFLTKIISGNSNEEIVFNYEPLIRKMVSPSGGYYLTGTDSPTFYRLSKSKSEFTSHRITEIESDNEKIIFRYNDRNLISGITLSSETLKEVEVLNKASNERKLLWNLAYNYYESKNDATTGTPLYNAEREAKLVSVERKPNTSTSESVGKYEFDYLNDALHRLPYNYDITENENKEWYEFYENNAVDFWGYYTGRDNSNTYNENRARIPETSLVPNLSPGLNWMFQDLTPNDETIKNGILKRITFPTGGYTEFEYEVDEFSWVSDQDATDVGGSFIQHLSSNPTLIQRALTSESSNLVTIDFELEDEYEAYFEIRVARKFYSWNRPCNYESGHGIGKLEKINGSQTELITLIEVTLEPYDEPGQGTVCDGIATGSKSFFYPSGSNNDETIRFTLQPGNYRITTNLECCDDLANNIAREDVYFAESILRYNEENNNSNNDPNNTTSYNQMVSFLGNIGYRQHADVSEYLNIQGGGIRVSKIKTYAFEGDPDPGIREFIYKESDSNGDLTSRSSGVMARLPRYADRVSILFDESSMGWFGRVQSGNFQPLSTTHGVNVGYREVTEKLGENGEYGKVRHVYLSPVELPDFYQVVIATQMFTYHIISATQDWARGVPLFTEYYDAAGTLLRKVVNQYEMDVAKNQDAFIPGLEMRTLETSIGGYDEDLCGGTCSTNISSYYATMDVHTTGVMNLISTEEIEYSSSGSNVKAVTEHEYFSPEEGFTLPRKTISTNSDNTKRVTEFVYAYEVYPAMQANSMFSQPFNTTIKNGSDSVLQSRWMVWGNNWVSGGSYWRPKCEFFWEGGLFDKFFTTTCPE